MFTGLVQSLGLVSALSNERLQITVVGESKTSILQDLAVGDSVAVDGICLTVETVMTEGLIASVSPETLHRTTLGHPGLGAQHSNLETSLRLGGKVGGHFVTGHVDGVGCLISSVVRDNSWEMTFGYPETLSQDWQKAIANYLIPKGSISVNGVSLTIAACDSGGNWFTVAVIPHTYQATNLAQLKPGNWVNLEADLIGKYVNKLLEQRLGGATADPVVSLDFLAEHGYL